MSEDADDALEAVYGGQNRAEAEIACGLLRSAGIEAAVIGDTLSPYAAAVNVATRGILVVVPRDRASDAFDVLCENGLIRHDLLRDAAPEWPSTICPNQECLRWVPWPESVCPYCGVSFEWVAQAAAEAERKAAKLRGTVAPTIVLYRPVGPKELELIKASDWKKFPPRLPDQPIFYPVMSEDYAVQIARDWNAKRDGGGYVTLFRVDWDFARRYEVHVVGGAIHRELWVPAEELEEFNRHIIGPIEVVAEFD